MVSGITRCLPKGVHLLPRRSCQTKVSGFVPQLLLWAMVCPTVCHFVAHLRHFGQFMQAAEQATLPELSVQVSMEPVSHFIRSRTELPTYRPNGTGRDRHAEKTELGRPTCSANRSVVNRSCKRVAIQIVIGPTHHMCNMEVEKTNMKKTRRVRKGKLSSKGPCSTSLVRV